MTTYRQACVIALTGLGLLVLAGVLALLQGEPTAEATDGSESRGKGGSVWDADYFPNIPLTTHEGEPVRFFELIEDRVVAISFIYTTCPDACPMEMARLMDVYRLLDGRVGDDVHFYSITIDPERDTVEVLRHYVEAWKVGEGWTFLTGELEDINLLRRKLGVYDPEDPGEDELDHNLNLVIGNQATGRWMRRSPFENPYILATQIGSWLHGWKLPGEGSRDYADAPEIRQISTGESLFRTRCASCHTIGGGAIFEASARRIGPDLLNVVEQRDREWLERWLKEPDVMIEEEDPLAMALLEQYKGIPMPNLRLTDVDVEKLLGFMEEESRRIAELRAARAETRGPHAEHGAHDTHARHDGHVGHGGDAGKPVEHSAP